MDEAFPDGFLWGAATSAFQIEGAALADGKGPSIWDVFCHTPGKTEGGAHGDIACDHYHRLREDIELMAELSLRAYRFSISWPRVLPQGRGSPNHAGIDFYDRLVDGLCERGIQPLATLFHWDLPAALQMELGGWTHPDLPHLFADYAALMFDRLGDRVRLWLTLNEPWCSVTGGYFSGVHAPGITGLHQGYLAGHNLLRAHARAAAAYRASRHGQGMISFALNSGFCFPASQESQDIEAAERWMLNFVGWFADPARFGDYPVVMRERLAAHLPAFSPQDSELLVGSMDFFALNYYSSDVIRFAPEQEPMQAEPVPQPDRLYTEMSWPVVPEGLHRLLHWLSRRYTPLPIFVTENGAAFPDAPNADGSVDDVQRIAYLHDHIVAVRRAIADGIDVRGYFVWSLLDNLEWSAGYTKRFGLIRCDFDNLQRTVKASGRWYAHLIRCGGLGVSGAPNREP